MLPDEPRQPAGQDARPTRRAGRRIAFSCFFLGQARAARERRHSSEFDGSHWQADATKSIGMRFHGCQVDTKVSS